MHGKMLAAIFKRPRQVEVEEFDIPRPDHDEVLVKVLYNGICGTDLRVWEGTHWSIEGWPLAPGASGHESVGEVVSVGAGVKGLSPGDKVAGFGGRSFAQYAVARDPILVADYALDRLSLTSPLSNAMNIVSLLDIKPGGKALVMGQGSIGLLVTKLLSAGRVEVIATDVIERRLKLSAKFGARAYDAGDPGYVERMLKEIGEIEGVVECAGSPKTLLPASEIVASNGTIVIYGCQELMALPYRPLRKKGVRIEFGTASTNARKGIDYTLDAIRALQRGSVDTEDIISARISLRELPDVLANFDRSRWIKVVVEPNRS